MLKNALGISSAEHHKAWDPALKQGARFNAMQGQIVASVVPELPLMDKTTGPNLGSLSLRETLGNMGPTETALERLDKQEFHAFTQIQDEFNQLLSELAMRERLLDAMERDPHGGGMEVGKYLATQLKCPHNWYKNAGTGDKCVQECPLDSQERLSDGRCKCGLGGSNNTCLGGIKCVNNACTGSGDVAAGLQRIAATEWASGGIGEASLKLQIKDLNTKIIEKANKIVRLSQAINTTDQQVEKEMGVQQVQLHGQLGRLRQKKARQRKLVANQQTLMGELNDTRADLSATYYEYLVWLIAAITLGALGFHKLMRR